MSAEQLKLRSSVKPTLMRFVLIRGTILGFIGACLLLYGALFLPAETLKMWGFPILILALILIAVGLIPYRRLTRRERYPDELIVDGSNTIHFNIRGEPTFSIPLQNMERYSYLEKGRLYGLGIWLKQPEKDKIEIHNSKFDLEKYKLTSQKQYECDIFLPFFTQRSYNILNAFIKEEG